MQVEKVSISLPAPMIQFIERYKNEHALKSRSQVVENALRLLREQELEHAYRLAACEQDAEYEVTIADGLADETW